MVKSCPTLQCVGCRLAIILNLTFLGGGRVFFGFILLADVEYVRNEILWSSYRQVLCIKYGIRLKSVSLVFIFL